MIAEIFQNVTLPSVTFNVPQLVTWLIIGLIAGAVASLLLRDRLGVIGSIAVGLLGALIGGFLFSVLNINPFVTGAGLTLPFKDLLSAFVGSLIVLLLVGGLFRRRRY